MACCATQRTEQTMMLEKAFLSPTSVVGLKRPTTSAFVSYIRSSLSVTMRNQEVMVLLVPRVLSPDDLAERLFLHSAQGERSFHVSAVICLAHDGKGITMLLIVSMAKWPQEQLLSPECLNHVVFNHCDP